MIASKIKKIWLAKHKVDFRKQEYGLLAECYRLGIDPFKGDCVIFIGTGRRKVKILYADRSGLLLTKKSFADQAMKTRLKFLSEPGIRSVSWSDLVLILEGSSYEIFNKVDEWPKEGLT